MKKVLFVCLSFWGVSSFAAATGVSPWGCPAEIEFKRDRIEEEIQAYLDQGQLETATELARSCANWGSSLDPALLAPVIDAHRAILDPVLTNEVKIIMLEMLTHCIQRGIDEGGTLGQSVSAHCQIKVLIGFLAGTKD